MPRLGSMWGLPWGLGGTNRDDLTPPSGHVPGPSQAAEGRGFEPRLPLQDPGVTAGPPPEGETVDFSGLPLPSLRHDTTWLRMVKRGGFHRGLLDPLDTYYG